MTVTEPVKLLIYPCDLIYSDYEKGCLLIQRSRRPEFKSSPLPPEQLRKRYNS